MNRQRWSEEEESFIQSNIESMKYSDIAISLNRTLISIQRKIRHMGLMLSNEEKIRRMREAAKNISRNQDGSLNPNWKGGISKNNYRYKKLQMERYPEKIKARNDVKRNVASGKIKKLPCKICGDANSFAHHNDYSKPLDVVWLCRRHHVDVHMGLIKAE